MNDENENIIPVSDSDAEVFAELAECCNDLIELSSPNGQLIYVNPVGRRMIGLEHPEETQALKLTDLMTADEARRQPGIARTVAQNGRWAGERTFKNLKTGREFPVHQSVFSIRSDATGELVYYGSFTRNLSSEQTLLASLSLFKNAADAANEGILITKIESNRNPAFYINPAFSALTGFSLDDVKDDCEILRKDAFDLNLDEIQTSIENRVACERVVKSLRRDGSSFWNKMSLSPVLGAENEVTHYITIIKDVSKELDAHESLRLETERLHLVLSSVEIGTWEWDLQTNTLIWDDQMYALHNLSRAEAPDPLLWWQTRVSTDELQDLIKLSEGNGQKPEPFKIKFDNGDIKYIRKLARLIRAPSGQLTRLIGVSWDVSDDVRAKETIEGQRLQIESSARLAQLGEMAGGIAHEINNPLAIISAFNDRLRDSIDNKNMNFEEFKHCTDRIGKTVARIAGIVKGLRLVAREGSKDPFEKTNLNNVINDTLSLCAERAKNRGIRLIVEGKVDTEVECRVVQISQVLTNLISNAIHATEPATGNTPSQTVERWVRIQAVDDGSDALIKISDSGAGIAEDIRAKIFQPFFTTKGTGEGTGLGLSISTAIIKDHQGTLILDSSQANTTFVIRLPKVQLARATSTKPRLAS